MSADDLTVLLAFVEQYGVPVFPLQPNGKTPLTEHGFKDASHAPAQVDKWGKQHPGCNWGMPTGAASDFAVLDIDMKNGKDGEQSLRRLIASHGPLPETAEVLTPSGGRHLYFRTNGAALRSTAGVLGDGLDVRADGGYVAIPTSRINGRAYEWEASSDPAEVGFAELPAWLAELAKEKPRSVRTENVEGAISEGGRNAHLTSLAGTMRRRGMTPAAILAALLAENAARCRPMLDEPEVRRIAESVGRYEPGGLNPAPDNADIEPLEIPPVSEWAETIPPRREWTWKDWIPAGRVTVLNGDGGTGKTLEAQIILTAYASERRHLYDIAMASGVALGVFCEDEKDELNRRQRDICASLGVNIATLENLHILSRVGENNLLVTYHDKQAFPTPFYWQVDATCARLRPALVAIDTAADTYGGNPIDQAEVRQFVQFILGGLCARHDCTILLTMHPSVAGIASGEGGGFSVAWNNSVRSRLYLSHPRVNNQPDYGRVMLTRKKSNYALRGEELHLIYESGAFIIDPNPAANAGTLKAEDMEAYAALLELDKGQYVKLDIWAEECVRRKIVKGKTDDAIKKAQRRIIDRLVTAELVTIGQGTRGFYRAVRAAD